MGICLFFFFQAEDGIRDLTVTGVQTCALPIYVDLLHRVEQLQDIGVRAVAERAQQRRRRELLLLVDVDVDHVVNVDRELDPRAAERNDPRREEALAVGVDALLEHDAGGAVQLRHDDALRSEEHTSELQSQSNLVCRLLLEKKKKSL